MRYHGCDPLRFSARCAIQVRVSGIPHLAKNERDVGHPGFVRGENLQSVLANNQARFPGRAPNVRPTCPGVPWGVHGPKTMGCAP
jgi:hypothetical protein